jgi:hypothetical protein
MITKTENPRSRELLACIGLALLCSMLAANRVSAVGSWTALANLAPGNVETMLLLSDGTVMAQNGGGTGWYRLTPDSTGHYVNGTWTTRASMTYSRLYYASQVLKDGRMFIAGGEYGNGTTNAEVYTPTSDSWTTIPVPAGLITVNNTIASSGNNTAGFIDSGSKILPDGRVIIFPVSPATSGRTVIFDPVSNTLSLGPFLFRGGNQDEASCVKLPDGSILTIDPFGQNSERYIPASNSFINDGTVPVAMYDAFGFELGPAFLLPNGKAFFIGSRPNTAIYTPTGTTSPGTWVAGAAIPSSMGAPDAPGAMMVNGKILCVLTPQPTSANHFPTPSSFYEYDYSVGAGGTFTQTASPVGGLTDSQVAYNMRMLVLPDGTVLFTRNSSQLYVYTPDTGPLAAGKPAISTLSQNSNGSYHLTGTLFNGISEGAAYGDDAQMDSAYPIVKITSGANVYYARTHDWSHTGVQLGSTTVTTEFDEPPGLVGGNYNLSVIANGIASDPISYVGPVWVDFNYGGIFQFGSFVNPYKTFAGGVSAVAPGGLIEIKSSNSTETNTYTKAMTVLAIGGPVKIGIGH